MKKISILFFLCAIIIAAIGSAFVQDVFLISPKPDAKPVVFTVEQGDSVNVIESHLQKEHLIAHPTFFKWFAQLSHTQNKLQAGTFFISPGTSISSIILILSNVKNAEVQVTIPEGFTNDQIKTKLVEAFSGFDTVAWDAQTKDLQGYLFPDTYRFSKAASVKDIVEKMRSTLGRRLIENQISVASSTMSLNEVLVMASLIEKEVQTPEDMKHVAGVFFNRLSIDMPLQTDTSSFTYKSKGLPPTPINNPGINAILAVLHPLKTDDVYFITLPNKPAIFAKTFQQHTENVQKYLSVGK